MGNEKFIQLLSDAFRQLDELNNLVKETIKVEEVMIDTALAIPLKVTLPA